ncbi:alpha/beta fold hydrolase [Sutcliffiella horikoshii]|uniref:alpha/beta fold hydrolase n=1 Tax=Sutcliffiella horikoshii TaxID=79883 RepID=UPI00384D7152
MIKEAKKVAFSKEYIEIDGHKTGLFLETVDSRNPVLLFLHGGPGFPQYPFLKKSELRWEEYFTVCYWEQRGTGMSYDASTQGKITFDRLCKDALVVTEYLKNKYNQEKIYLCGHSWGTMLGSHIVHLHPEHFHAYIGVGQMGRHYESNQHTYAFLLDSAVEKGDKRAEKDIRSVTLDKEYYKSQEYRRILGRYLNKFGGGAKRTGYSNWQGIKHLFSCSHYTWKEKLNFPKGIFASYDALSETMAKTDTVQLAPRFDVPVHIIHGKHDYQTSYQEAKRFYELIEAPFKKMYTFEQSAHSPFVEEHEEFRRILEEEVLGR